MNHPDRVITEKINSLAGSHPALDRFMDLTAKYGHIAFVLYGLFLWIYPSSKRASYRRSCCSILIGMMAGSWLMSVIRLFWNRKRPFAVNSAVWNFTGHKDTPSFPSSHTFYSFLIASVAAKEKLPFSLPLRIGAFLIAFSRLYAGLHYPSDLLGGMALAHIVRAWTQKPSVKAAAAGMAAAGSAFYSLALWMAKRKMTHGR